MDSYSSVDESIAIFLGSSAIDSKQSLGELCQNIFLNLYQQFDIYSLTRLCLEGFLLSFLKASEWNGPRPIPPPPAARFPRPDCPDSPSLRMPS